MFCEQIAVIVYVVVVVAVFVVGLVENLKLWSLSLSSDLFLLSKEFEAGKEIQTRFSQSKLS
jgi:hypothetical protein